MIEVLAVAAADVEHARIVWYCRGQCRRFFGQIDKNHSIPATRATRQPRAKDSADQSPRRLFHKRTRTM